VPAAAVIGASHRGGDKQFWDVGGGGRIVVIELAGAEHSAIVVQVDPLVARWTWSASRSPGRALATATHQLGFSCWMPG
jgi:hypothetical protein